MRWMLAPLIAYVRVVGWWWRVVDSKLETIKYTQQATHAPPNTSHANTMTYNYLKILKKHLFTLCAVRYLLNVLRNTCLHIKYA